MVNTYALVSAVVFILAIALFAAYQMGLLDPVVEEIGILYFKSKAEAEKKKLQAQGMKEGEDFVKGDLLGNKQAQDVTENLGGFNVLKKEL